MIKKINRVINYFELDPTFEVGKSVNDFSIIFETIIELNTQRDKDRFMRYSDKLLYLSGVSINDKKNFIMGKIHAIRMDAFPELFNLSSDEFKDITSEPDEGIIETSHFILSVKDKLILSLEFNQFGPRISDLITFINRKGETLKILKSLSQLPYSKDDLSTYKRRIGKVSRIIAKVHKDNIGRLKDYDAGLFHAMKTAKEVTDAEVVTMVFKYNYRKLLETTKANGMVGKFIDLIGLKNLNPFDTLQVYAEDSENNDALKNFDILNIWLKTNIRVEQKEKSKAIISSDIFTQMEKEFLKEFKL